MPVSLKCAVSWKALEELLLEQCTPTPQLPFLLVLLSLFRYRELQMTEGDTTANVLLVLGSCFRCQFWESVKRRLTTESEFYKLGIEISIKNMYLGSGPSKFCSADWLEHSVRQRTWKCRILPPALRHTRRRQHQVPLGGRNWPPRSAASASKWHKLHPQGKGVLTQCKISQVLHVQYLLSLLKKETPLKY